MGSIEQGGPEKKIELLEYPATPYEAAVASWHGYAEAGAGESSGYGHDAEGRTVPLSAEIERRIADESRRSFAAGRERGLEEASQSERETRANVQNAVEEYRVRQGAELIASVAQERDRYLRSVEHEVVKLALAIAARILRREAQMDPLLLTGAVRVALGQLSGSTEVRLRVPPAELELWTDAVALLPNQALKAAISAGEGMRLGDCVIETSLGSVDLGVRSQLSEIERGFFDRAGNNDVANKLTAGAAAAEDGR
jgi:flagellar assembly protein FliH